MNDKLVCKPITINKITPYFVIISEKVWTNQLKVLLSQCMREYACETFGT